MPKYYNECLSFNNLYIGIISKALESITTLNAIMEWGKPQPKALNLKGMGNLT
jgi:hypothetical protein